MQHNFVFFSAAVVFSWLVISNLLPKFSRDVVMATRLTNLLHKFGKDTSRMHCIFNIFASAAGLGIGDFRYVSEVCKGCFHGNLILDFIAKNAKN